MPSDNPVAKRNALVIPAGLVLFYCVLAILYAELIRSDATLCKDGGKILVRYVCYNVWKLLLPLVLIAFGVLLGGLLGFRTRRTGATADLYHGSTTHFVMALLASFVVVSLLGLVIQSLRERALGTTFVISAYGIDFQHVFLLGLATVVGALMLLPFLALYLHQDHRRRRFLEVARLPDAEPVLRQPGVPEDEEQGMWAPLEEEWSDQEAWGGEARPEPGVAPTPRGPPEPPVAQPPLTERDDAEFQEGIFLAGVLDAQDRAAGQAEAEVPAETPEPAETPGPAEALPEGAEAEAGGATEAETAEPEGSVAEPARPSMADAIARLHEPPSYVPVAVDRIEEPPEEERPAAYYDYPDVSRPVSELPGINPAAAELLDIAGIRTTARLRYESDDTVSHAAGVPRDRVRKWKQLAELLTVPGIGPAYAQALVAAGVTGIDDLKRLAPGTIHKRVGEDHPSITPKRIEAWQENARGLRRVRRSVPEE